MDQEAKPNVLRSFLKLDLRDKVLWLLAFAMAAVIAVSMIYEISIQSVRSSVPSDTTRVWPPAGYTPRTITMDPEGNLWVWTSGKDLLIYDGETWETVDGLRDVSQDGVYVNDIAFDAHGQAWIGTDRQGLIIYDGEDLNQVDLSLTGEYIETIAFDAADQAWVGSWTGLHVFNGESWYTYTSDNSALSGRIVDVAFDSQGRAWIETQRGLFQFDGENWAVFTTENSGLVNIFGRVVAVDAQDQIWIGTEGGLNLFNGYDWETHLTDNDDFNADCIGDIFFDAEGKVWVFSQISRPNELGTTSGTVSVFDGENWISIDQINLNGIRSVTMDPEGRIWFLLADRSIIVTSSDLSDPVLQNAAQSEVDLDVRYPFLRLDSLIKPLIGLAFIGAMIFFTRLDSNYSLASLLIPVLSFLIFSTAGFNLEAEDFYIPFGNILLLFFGLYLAGKGNRAGESRGLTATAIILNIVMLLLYFLQFLFVATFG